MRTKKKYGLAILICLLLTATVSAQQGWNGETEVLTDGKEKSVSQYLSYDAKDWGLTMRYFRVQHTNGHDGINRGEIAFGPTFHVKEQTEFKLQFGATTDKDIMVLGAVKTKLGHRTLNYTADVKLSTTHRHNTLFQKVSVVVDAKESFHFRGEHLQVGRTQEFLRLGPEYQQHLPRETHFFINPFADPIKKAVGIQLGFRLL